MEKGGEYPAFFHAYTFLPALAGIDSLLILYGRDFYKQSCLSQRRTQGEVKGGSSDHRYYCVDTGGDGCHLGQGGGDILGDAQQIGFVEISYRTRWPVR